MTIQVMATHATKRQLLLALLQEQRITRALIEGNNILMSDVNASLQGLTTAVDNVGREFSDLNRALQAALSDKANAEAALAAALANDATDAETIADLRRQLEAATTNLDTVAGQIDNQVRILNQLGTPVGPAPEPTPTDEPAPVPPVEEPPADAPPADTTPTDQPPAGTEDV